MKETRLENNIVIHENIDDTDICSVGYYYHGRYHSLALCNNIKECKEFIKQISFNEKQYIKLYGDAE